VVTENTDDHLHATLTERLDDLIIVVKDILALWVCEAIYATLLSIIVDVVCEEHEIVDEKFTVLSLELERIERVGVVYLEENDHLLVLAWLCHTLERHVLYKVNKSWL
jgi:hypothetical protein